MRSVPLALLRCSFFSVFSIPFFRFAWVLPVCPPGGIDSEGLHAGHSHYHQGWRLQCVTQWLHWCVLGCPGEHSMLGCFSWIALDPLDGLTGESITGAIFTPAEISRLSPGWVQDSGFALGCPRTEASHAWLSSGVGLNAAQYHLLHLYIIFLLEYRAFSLEV